MTSLALGRRAALQRSLAKPHTIARFVGEEVSIGLFIQVRQPGVPFRPGFKSGRHLHNQFVFQLSWQEQDLSVDGVSVWARM